MSDLIPLHQFTIGTETHQTVNARELHAFLGVKQRVLDWIAKRIEQYGFEEGRDFTRYYDSSNGNPHPQIDYFVTINMAKELSMVERTRKGKEARQWFLECEQVVLQGQAITPTPAQAAVAIAQAVLVIEQRQLAIEARQDAQDAKLQTILDRQPPPGKLRPGDWLRRHSKPHLSPDLMKALNAACRSLESAEYWRPEGYDWMVPYHTAEVIAHAYEDVTRQLSFIHDPGVGYARKRGRR